MCAPGGRSVSPEEHNAPREGVHELPLLLVCSSSRREGATPCSRPEQIASDCRSRGPRPCSPARLLLSAMLDLNWRCSACAAPIKVGFRTRKRRCRNLRASAGATRARYGTVLSMVAHA